MNPRVLRIALAITSLLLTGIVSEVALRVVDAAKPARDRRGLHEPRPDRPWLFGLRPGAAGTLPISGDTLYRINSNGFRDIERVRPRPDGVFRIILLGDSVGFGYGVEANEMFTHLLEEQLAGASGAERIEVLNLAVSGYNPYTQAALLEDVGRSYEPDLVIVQFCINDLNDPTLHFDAQTRLHLGTIPDAAFPDPAARRSEATSAASGLSLCRRSRICSLVDDLVLAARARDPDQDAKLAAARPVDGSDGPEWPWIEALYLEMARASREMGAGFAVLAFPYPAQLGGHDPDPVQTRLIELGKRNGWHTINPLPRFRTAARRREELFMDFWHPTPPGHQLAADELLESRACAGLLPDSAATACDSE